MTATKSFGNPKISTEVIELGTTVRDAVHSTLFAAPSEAEKPYPAAIENISTAATALSLHQTTPLIALLSLPNSKCA